MKTETLPIFDPTKSAAAKPKGWPVLRLGFRPFYIGGALLAALIVPLWVAMFLGLTPFTPAVSPLLWHAHEMLFGFAVAIIIGFLLTAVKAWTGLATPRGAALAALAALWLAARIAALTGPYAWYAVLDVALLPLVAVVLIRLILKSKNHRNLLLGLILSLLALANLAFHLAVMGVLNVPAMTPLYAGLALIVMIETVIAGRVIPAFTMSATPGLKLVASAWLERATLALTALSLAIWVFFPPSLLGALVLAVAAALHVKRWLGWRSMLTRGRPILWVLHVAYAWIPMGLALLALTQVGWVGASAGVHALGVGATGGLIIGMLTRTARGHTGRALAVTRAEVMAYGLVFLAAVLRAFVLLVAPGWLAASLVVAAVAWAAAFVIYLWIYTPWLVQTRADGKDG
jgi:uncharacterized protein involved in response to NO